MSLLLDALKKTGENQQKGTGPSGLTLEEASSSRAAGETLFAAKRERATRHWNLGLIPTTLLICSVLGAGYGYYVWLETQPPSLPSAVKRAAPPPPAPVATVPLVPLVRPPEEAVAQPEVQPVVTARNEDFDAPRRKPSSTRTRNRTPGSGVAIQSRVEADDITPALIEAWQAYRRGDYIAAAQGYRQVLAKDAHNRDALLGMAATAQQQGQDEAAQRYYRQMLILDPRDPDAHAALSVYMTGDAGDSESRLRQLLAGQPRSGALNFALGNLYAEQSNWGDAQQYYFNAYALEPANAQFAFNLAVSMDHLGQRKLAAQHYQQALQLDVSGNSGFDHAQAQQRLNELTTAR
jgi:Flp pilus assembly protein TadD